MEQKNVLSQALELIKDRQRHSRWLRFVTGMAAAVVFVTTYLLILPAITMERSTLEVSALHTRAALGDTLITEIFAEAEDGREETVFVLKADGDNAGLDETQIEFDDEGIAQIEDEEGLELELHREYGKDGVTSYWFVLEEGDSVCFQLPWINGTDRYRTEEVSDETGQSGGGGQQSSGQQSSGQQSGGQPSSGQTEESSAAEEETIPGGENSKEESTSPAGDEASKEENTSEGGTEKDDSADEAEKSEEESSSAEDGNDGKEENSGKDDGNGEDDSKGEDDSLASDSNASYASAGMNGGASLWRISMSAVENTGEAALVSKSRHKVLSVTVSSSRASGSQADREPQSEKEDDSSYTDIILDQEGDSEAEGFLTISYGSGASLEKAKKRANDSLELSWLSGWEEETMEIPEDAANWAAVWKEGFSATASQASRSRSVLRRAVLLAEDGERSSHDFVDNITSVTVSKLENGQWVPGTEFTDGDSVRVEINYMIPANTVGANNQTIHYQLPDGIRLSREESGTVYDGETPVGTYVISADGLITITFNETFSDNRPFTGMIRFEGTLSAGENGEEQEIEFGGSGGTITVKPSTSPTDIHVEKEGSYNKEDEKLHYTVTVSTTKGTGDTVTISDNFGTGNTSAAYDQNSFQIVKVKADGTQETVSGYTPEFGTAWQGGPEKFTISGLPKLEAGEKYIVTYTATPGETSDDGGASSVNNNATGTSGGDSNNSGVTVTISQQMLQKWGNYNSGTGKIQWTITLNSDKQDIGGYTLKDAMTIGGETVSIPSGTVITMTGSDGSSQTITLPYTFPKGSNDSYTITYETDAPQGQPGESWTVSNKAELEGDGDHYEAGGNVTGQTQGYNVGKSFDGLDQNASTDEVGSYKWVSRITVPKTGVELDNLTYTDTLTGAVLDGKEVAGSHYITAALLDKLTVTVNGTTLERGTDYQICDAQGNPITDFTSENHLTGFQVKFLEAAKDKVTGQTIELRYQTQVDYTKLTGDGTYTIRNKGSIPGHDSESSTTYEPPQKLEKQASITGEGGSSYTGDSITIDYEASGGIIHYRLLLRTDENTQGDITVTDLIPRGATLVEDSVKMAFYGNDWYEYDTNGSGYKASEHIHAAVGETKPDGTTPVTFTIDDGYNGDGQHHVLVVYYDLSIKDDPLWEEDPGLESHLYRNKVSWDSESDGTDVTVEREVPDIKKTGEQLPQYDADGNPMMDDDEKPILSNTIRYGIIINAGAKDLNPSSAFITMWDELDIDKAAGAEFLPGSVKLYHYDAKQENNCGAEIDSSLYSYTYDETEYKLTFSLPDETACVLVYEYIIDRGTAAGDLTIKNEAHLTGGTGSGGSDEVILQDTSSSAVVTKKDLTLYKVDATNYGKLLPGAVFELKVYTKEAGWKDLPNFTTDKNGQFVLSYVQNEDYENFNFEDNTLYCLTEVIAPTGYSPDDRPYYFVWVENGKTAEQVKQEMKGRGALGDVDADSVRFLTTSGSIYVPNQPTELTVKKLWQSENGMTTRPGADSVKLILYQQAVDTNARKVTVNSQGNQQNGWIGELITKYIDVAEGSSLTIQITDVYTGSLDIQVGSGEKISVPTGSGQVWVYTIDSITGDTTIQISPTDQDEGNSFGNISFSDYTEPYSVPIGDVVEYKTVTLSAENNWSYTWSDLPKQNEKGQTVYYHVKEETSIPGFEVIYSANNNDGIQAGDLTVINRSTGYILPETGGPGISMFAAGGLALLATTCLMYIILRRKEDEVS